MNDAVIAERTYQIDGVDVALRIYEPFLEEGGDYRCDYEIDWPERSKRRSIAGVDGIQAIELALKTADTDLRYSDAYKSGRLTLFGERNLCLPTLDLERTPMKLAYAIKFVADMDKAVAFHRDILGLPLAFASPFWSEFATGDTRLALHIADADHQAGTTRLGYATEDLGALYDRRAELGLTFTESPKVQHGTRIAPFLDSEGAECSMSG